MRKPVLQAFFFIYKVEFIGCFKGPFKVNVFYYLTLKQLYNITSLNFKTPFLSLSFLYPF